ncbi:MAG: nuclear transport factor 2 family protein [Gammaproteobacteria bacterium]
MFRRISLFLFLAGFSTAVLAADSDVVEKQEQTVRLFVAAFNAHDTDAMLEMVTDDIQWLSISGEDVATDAGNKEQLRSGMTDYFKSCSSCQSRLANMFSTGTRVTALEIASFDSDDGPQEQQSLSVYEFSGALIQRVYYFPVEKPLAE